MKIREIIKALEGMPQDAEMGHLWDGAVRSDVEVIYLAQSGIVVGAPKDEPAYYDEDRPVGAPTSEEHRYWKAGDVAQSTSSDDNQNSLCG